VSQRSAEMFVCVLLLLEVASPTEGQLGTFQEVSPAIAGRGLGTPRPFWAAPALCVAAPHL